MLSYIKHECFNLILWFIKVYDETMKKKEIIKEILVIDLWYYRLSINIILCAIYIDIF